MHYTNGLQTVIRTAATEAKLLGHSYVGSGHLLLALCQEPSFAGQLLRGVGINAEGIQDLLVVLCGKGTPGLPLPQGFSRQARKILRGAGTEAQMLSEKQVDSIHLLLSLLRQEKTAAKELLMICHVDTQELFGRTVDGLRWGPVQPVMQKKETFTFMTRIQEQAPLKWARWMIS